VDAWCVGYYGPEDHPRRRLSKPLLFVRTNGVDNDNGYARPVEGIYIVVDHQTMQVVEFEDRGGAPIPPPDPLRNYIGEAAPPAFPLKPLHITQPQGPSFIVDGTAVAWHNWRFRIGFTPREGLVLNSLSIFDQDKLAVRMVAHRLSFTEMVVPYGDPTDPHFRKNAFDAGEDGLGKNANSLKLGCDCLGEIRYFDAHLTNFHGEVQTIENAVCMHEEDHGILWKHTDWRTDHTASRRSRRLVISFVCTIANYEYGFFYYLYMDGTIEFEVKLTGVLSTGAIAVGETSEYGTQLAPGLYAPYHQHFFVARMHMAVDATPGKKTANSVVQIDTVAKPTGPQNPHGNAFVVRETLLESEGDAGRDCRSISSRHWEIRNNDKVNRNGMPTAWRLVPHKNVLPFASPEAKFQRRAGFLNHNLWVTNYNLNERFPGGEFPNQNPRVGAGLTTWIQRDGNLVDGNLVLWYVFGVTHIPRLEDWPVMPVEYTGFALKPSGFFDRSPVINTELEEDAAPTMVAKSCL